MTAPTTREDVLRELNYYFKSLGNVNREAVPGYERDCVSMVWRWLQEARAEEREECAKVAVYGAWTATDMIGEYGKGYHAASKALAAAIRARGKGDKKCP